MPQMMPIWWSVILMLSLMFFMCMNSILYFFPLYKLVEKTSSMNKKIKFINISKYGL